MEEKPVEIDSWPPPEGLPEATPVVRVRRTHSELSMRLQELEDGGVQLSEGMKRRLHRDWTIEDGQVHEHDVKPDELFRFKS